MENYIKLKFTDNSNTSYKLQLSNVEFGDAVISINKALAQLIHFWGNELGKSLGEKLDLLQDMNILAKLNLENFAEHKLLHNELVVVEYENREI